MTPPEGIMPMSIKNLRNSSVATVPALLDLIRKNRIKNQTIHRGHILLFANIGAGMNINAIVYQY
tara:strand:+ start:215 stop:409 length:195 start_codon:yes stop_codon:yes gene_type:complete